MAVSDRGQCSCQDYGRLHPPPLRHRLHQATTESSQEDDVRTLLTDKGDSEEDGGHHLTRGDKLHSDPTGHQTDSGSHRP